jgi:hypothetical protein
VEWNQDDGGLWLLDALPRPFFRASVECMGGHVTSRDHQKKGLFVGGGGPLSSFGRHAATDTPTNLDIKWQPLPPV